MSARLYPVLPGFQVYQCFWCDITSRDEHHFVIAPNGRLKCRACCDYEREAAR